MRQKLTKALLRQFVNLSHALLDHLDHDRNAALECTILPHPSAMSFPEYCATSSVLGC